MKVKLEFFKCMGIILANLCHPYSLIPTVLSDSLAEPRLLPRALEGVAPRGCKCVQKTPTQRRSDMPEITSLINEIFADAAFIPRRECMGS